MGTGQLAGVDQLLVRGIGIAPAQILPDGAGEQRILLQHHGNLITQHIQIVVPDIHTAHLQAALRNVVQSGYELNQGGFAGAGTAQNAHRGAAGDVQVDILQGITIRGPRVAE